MASISFSDHPRSVNETYGQHLLSAWSFAGPMIYGGLACFMHGLFPFTMTTTGSSIIRRLHDRMITHRIHKLTDKPSGPIPSEANNRHGFQLNLRQEIVE